MCPVDTRRFCHALAVIVARAFTRCVRADLPPEAYRFYALYDVYESGGVHSRRVAEFTPWGPIDGTFCPHSHESTLHVAVDPRGPDYYVFKRWTIAERLDSQTGRSDALPLTDDELIDHPTGVTFETKRNRLVLCTMGSEGFLHAYSPEQNAWSRLASLHDEDVYSVTYSAYDDVFYGLTADGILRYGPSGSPAGWVGLASPLPAITPPDSPFT